ncbi:hypothetical protein BpHYR1_047965 [Brachionus plicatilis]|uniref:Uncharacterized protein n=1 Tax=Brachionus plicatilis TaxID=10195 RepID=A0A3M7T9R4_BRAPC|nr:hypothetical protein BpHYR1_047965 [Brachionus plicatilis]
MINVINSQFIGRVMNRIVSIISLQNTLNSQNFIQNRDLDHLSIIEIPENFKTFIISFKDYTTGLCQRQASLHLFNCVKDDLCFPSRIDFKHNFLLKKKIFFYLFFRTESKCWWYFKEYIPDLSWNKSSGVLKPLVQLEINK